MDLRRPRPGEWIAAFSGAALFVSLFLSWYRLEAGERGRGLLAVSNGAETGWEAFAVTDLALAFAGLLGVTLVLVAATQRTVAIPIALSSITALVGMVALLLVVLRLLFEPGPPVPGGLESSVDVEKAVGAWVALAAAAGVTAGGWIAMRDERIDELRRRGGVSPRLVPPPEIDQGHANRP
jgi:hypothetical protein